MRETKKAAKRKARNVTENKIMTNQYVGACSVDVRVGDVG